MNDFAKMIIKNLKSNGFPQKKVSLPTEKMYEIADNKGYGLNAVLESLSLEEGILAEVGNDKIVFSAKETASSDPFSGLEGQDLMKKAQDMMAKMDPAELRRIQEQFSSMSETEKEDLMKQGRDMGIV